MGLNESPGRPESVKIPGLQSKYVPSSLVGSGPMIMSMQDAKKRLVPLTAAFSCEYGVQGNELKTLTLKCMEGWVRHLELEGYELYPMPNNPAMVVYEDGTPVPSFSLYKGLERSISNSPDEATDYATAGGGDPTLQTPRNLEESEGLVDYTLVGVFWAPEYVVEVLKSREEIKEIERRAKNPSKFILRSK